MKIPPRIYEASYPFIRGDILLTAIVNADSGKQTLEMRKLNKNGRIELKDSIECIHTAIMQIPMEEFAETMKDEQFMDRILNIRSSEKLLKIDLEPKEKFKAFKSWVAGIAEAGLDAFKIQSDIENWGKLGAHPISHKLMKFVAGIDRNVLLDFLIKIERECKFEGVKHEQSMIANLQPILKIIEENEEDLIKGVFSIDPPINLFIKESQNAHFLHNPEAVDISDFEKAFSSKDSQVLIALAQNPRAPEFSQFKKFFKKKNLIRYLLRNPGAVKYTELKKYYSYKTEFSWEYRTIAASNTSAYLIDEFKNFFSIITEPDFLVRKNAAGNICSLKFPEFKNFLSKETEPDGRVRKAASNNLGAERFPEYRNFLSVLTEPRSPVRAGAASNPNAVFLPEFKNFLSLITEPSKMVRIKAASNPNAIVFPEFKNFLSVKTEPNDKVRRAAAKNKAAMKFAEYGNFLNIQTEPSKIIRCIARSNKIFYETY